MQLTSNLPLPMLFFKHWHTDDTEVGVIIVKGTFKRQEDGTLQPAENIGDILEADSFRGDPATSSLLRDQELAPGKLATDVFINAVAHSPKAKKLTDWSVSIEIPEKLHYEFRVFGPWEWRKHQGGWIRSNVMPVSQVPLTYELAYGGIVEGEEETIFEFNPVGQGFVTKDVLGKLETITGPQIGEIAEFKSNNPLDQLTVHGFGPISKTWLPRRSEAGTFDEDWQETRHPQMPNDYSLRFWNSAPLSMQVDPFLSGDEQIHLRGVHPNISPLTIQLPNVGMVARLKGENPNNVMLSLDTVDIDVSDINLCGITLIWRGIVPDPSMYEEAEVSSFWLEN